METEIFSPRPQKFVTFRTPGFLIFQKVNLIYLPTDIFRHAAFFEPSHFARLFLCTLHNFRALFSTLTDSGAKRTFNRIFTFAKNFPPVLPSSAFFTHGSPPSERARQKAHLTFKKRASKVAPSRTVTKAYLFYWRGTNAVERTPKPSKSEKTLCGKFFPAKKLSNRARHAAFSPNGCASP